MKFLIDNALSPLLAIRLSEQEHDVLHVRDVGLTAADDESVLDKAQAEARILVSADSDFGTILAERHSHAPSVIMLRGEVPHRPEAQARLLQHVLDTQPDVITSLEQGCIAVVSTGKIRIRTLPILG